MVSVGVALRAFFSKVARKMCTCCCADYDEVYDSAEVVQISSEAPANSLTVQTSENWAFANVSEDTLNQDVESSSEYEKVTSETPANSLTVQTSENGAFASVLKKMTGIGDDQSNIGKKEYVMEMDTNLHLLFNPDLRNEIPTEDETGTKVEQFCHATYREPLQYTMVAEEEQNACFEAEILDGIDHFFTEEDSEPNQNESDLDPTMIFCKFPNLFNNCWLNAAMQSLLNLSTARQSVIEHPEDIFGALSETPLCAGLLCSAMYHPGRYFFPEEIYQVLLEITENMQALDFTEQNNPIYFLHAILESLKPCINTLDTVCSKGTCEECQTRYSEMYEFGPIIALPDPVPYDSTISLLNRIVAEYKRDCCGVCDSVLKKELFIWGDDVMVLYLGLPPRQGNSRCPVIPSAIIDIPVKGGTQLYRLSSVICRQILSPENEHYYTYLMCGQMVCKAQDIKVTISDIDCVEDICHNGFIYIYEMYTEDAFSVWIQDTPEQEKCNPESATNLPTMTRFVRELKALTHSAPQIV